MAVRTEVGAIIRESDDGNWVAGIAWDNFLSAQGHNPWTCVHLSRRAGALALDEFVTRHGRIYLFDGNVPDCLLKCDKQCDNKFAFAQFSLRR